MKDLFGRPGKISGLVLRIMQCLFAAASIGIMASAHGFTVSTAFCYLIASMGLQILWSSVLACIDIHALWLKRDLNNQIVFILFFVGDWVTATLSLAAACSSAGVAVLFVKDTNLCRPGSGLSCSMFQIAVSLAFVAWFLLAITSYVLFWLVASP
ncbi:hypothetical protein Leryth_009792 [Lithospermum erythrorhizon]|uniref:CASP-like protein n=1 Tax=Lithospermum erythrorhizon TaxID=34254 RepID=A0AAV3QLK4_LITER|nr:hypothetical protein Leryth_009792 [Lithospermum erythrorhizon]